MTRFSRRDERKWKGSQVVGQHMGRKRKQRQLQRRPEGKLLRRKPVAESTGMEMR